MLRVNHHPVCADASHWYGKKSARKTRTRISYPRRPKRGARFCKKKQLLKGRMAWYRALMACVATAVDAILRSPVLYWVRYAPEAVGGWEGAEDADVCAKLTGVAAAVWTHSEDMRSECLARIERNVNAKLVVPLVLVYAFALWHMPRLLVRRWLRSPAQNPNPNTNPNPNLYAHMHPHPSPLNPYYAQRLEHSYPLFVPPIPASDRPIPTQYLALEAPPPRRAATTQATAGRSTGKRRASQRAVLRVGGIAED